MSVDHRRAGLRALFYGLQVLITLCVSRSQARWPARHTQAITRASTSRVSVDHRRAGLRASASICLASISVGCQSITGALACARDCGTQL